MGIPCGNFSYNLSNITGITQSVIWYPKMDLRLLSVGQ